MATSRENARRRSPNRALSVPPTAAAVHPDPSRSDHVRDFIFKLIVIVLAGLWIYAPAYHGDWLWDDDQAITANAVTQGPWSFRDIWIAPPGEIGRAHV